MNPPRGGSFDPILKVRYWHKVSSDLTLGIMHNRRLPVVEESRLAGKTIKPLQAPSKGSVMVNEVFHLVVDCLFFRY